VVLAGRRLQALHESIAFCGDPFRDIQARALAVSADVTRPDAVSALFDVVRARFGRLDFLFNSAGVHTPAMPLDELPVDHWRVTLDTQLAGTFLCTQEAFRIMKAQSPRGGRILNSAAVPAHPPGPLSVAVAATRHGMAGLTQACALEGSAVGIAVGLIDVGQAGSRRPQLQNAASAVLHIANLPLDVNLTSVCVSAT